MNKLKGKVAIVTGASKGIGAGIARAFAAEGASVVVNYASDRAGAARLVDEIQAEGGRAVAVQADVSSERDVERLFEESSKAFGRLDVLVNNAGVYRFAPLSEIGEDEFHREFSINVLGPILTTQRALRYFGTEGGSVINVSSVVSRLALPNSVIYSATKSALDSLTRSLSRELGRRKIRVNTLSPGATETEGLSASGLFDSEFQKQTVDKTPLGRFGTPHDIARAAVFLASDDAAWVTGEALAAAGGFG
ncbi:MAG: glucose 1-dehydrogenase [Polyangiaceae bacterium]